MRYKLGKTAVLQCGDVQVWPVEMYIDGICAVSMFWESMFLEKLYLSLPITSAGTQPSDTIIRPDNYTHSIVTLPSSFGGK